MAGPRPDDGIEPALVVILGGVAAALHVGKLPPAIATLQLALGLTLVQAGFLLSLLQLAGMVFGLAFGVLADGIGARRSMVLGLTVLAAASALGGAANGVAPLMLLRTAEGFGFLLAVLPAPGLVRRLAAPGRVNAMLGLWGAYMPLATALALLAGPLAIAALGWRGWWWLLAAASLAMALWLAAAVPAAPAAPGEARPGPAATAGIIGAAGGVHIAGMAGMAPTARNAAAAGMAGMVSTARHAGPAAAPLTWRMRLARTLAAPGPWLVALSFWLYSGQWLAVIGFLPAIYTAAGLGAGTTALLTALAAGVNMVGNIGAGRLLQRGWPAQRLLRIGFATMGLAALVVFAAGAIPTWLRYAAALLFSSAGGLIPATLFALAVRLAPGEAMLGSTVGWVQQWSAFGQFAAPPLVAWVAMRTGSWHFTWIVTGSCSVLGLLLSLAIARRLHALSRMHTPHAS
jgi:MFS family permease